MSGPVRLKHKMEERLAGGGFIDDTSLLHYFSEANIGIVFVERKPWTRSFLLVSNYHAVQTLDGASVPNIKWLQRKSVALLFWRCPFHNQRRRRRGAEIYGLLGDAASYQIGCPLPFPGCSLLPPDGNLHGLCLSSTLTA